jgi:polysaccharide chain length determinant protein (PEP-CTERM system associated)
MGEEGAGTVSAKDPALLAMSQYTERIDAMQSQLDQLLLQYTEKHPDIITLRERVADLQARRESELDDLAAQMSEQKAIAGKVTSEAAMMPALAVAESEAQAAALEARVTEYRKQVEDLEKLVDTVPEIEAELTRLDRDYGLNKEQYEQLFQRREAARLSEQVDEQSEDVKLKVIDPPKVPIVPSGPNRVMLFSGVFAAALGLGGVFAFLLAQIQPRFYTVEELKELTRLPVLGAVSYQSSRRYRTERRMELAVFLMIFLMLASVYGGLVVSESLHMDLHGKFAALAGREA